jgi:hypothetical protein
VRADGVFFSNRWLAVRLVSLSATLGGLLARVLDELLT